MEEGDKSFKDFTDLDIWKLGHRIRKEVYDLTKELPEEEKYNLCAQARRSACSISANIAEGYGRFHYQENIQYCRQARGSLEETRDHLIAIGSIYTQLQERAAQVIRVCLEEKAKINGFIAYLRKRKKAT